MNNNNFATFWKRIMEIIISVPSTNIVFNRYCDINEQVDLSNAATIRMMNLKHYMAEATRTASILVVGEALVKQRTVVLAQ